MRVDLDRKRVLKGSLISLGMAVFPLVLGFLLSFSLKRASLFETICSLFVLVYLAIVLIMVVRKDELVYRKGRFKNKEEYRQSEERMKFRFRMIVLLVPIVLLIVSSVLIFFFYSV